MPEMSELVLSTLTQAQRRVEVASQNLANAATPSYKRKIAFSSLVRNEVSGSDLPQVNVSVDVRPGKIVATQNPSDIAITGPGFFAFSNGGSLVFSRSGQMTVNADGRLINADGLALQMANGNDLIVKSANFEIGEDGSVVEQGSLLGKVAVYAPAFVGPDPVDRTASSEMVLLPNASMQQGAIEASNVTSGDEMVAMIEALRRAESGQRVMSIYDDMLGRVITSFGESVR